MKTERNANKYNFLFMAKQPLLGQGLLIIEALRSYSDTPQSAGLLWTTHRTLHDNTQHSQQTDIHVPRGILTCSPSKQEGADPSRGPRGQWDRETGTIKLVNTG